MKDKVRNIIFDHPQSVGKVLHIANFMNPSNHIKGTKANTVEIGAAIQNNCCISIEGRGTSIIVDDFTRLFNTTIYIHGNNNYIHIGKRCYLFEAEFYIEDSYNEIIIGEHTSVSGKTQFASIEGTKIIVGEDCMFSQDINVRTGDAHGIYDLDGNRINKSKDVSIGDHCWIGMRSIIMKGAVIRDNSVVGAASVVTRTFDEGNCIIAGTPGNIIRKNIEWKRERNKG